MILYITPWENKKYNNLKIQNKWQNKKQQNVFFINFKYKT